MKCSPANALADGAYPSVPDLVVPVMVLIQILLPTGAPGMAPADIAAALTETRDELTSRFEGLTAYLRSPARGVWTAPDGHVEHDDVVMVEVVTERFDQPWWRAYAASLAARFRQKTMHVRAWPVLTLEENAS